jgi:hypothetical protein
VEVVIGVAILSLVMASATTVAVNSSKSGTDSYDQLRASELAEEGIEAIHNYRDEWIRTNPMADLSSQVTKWQTAMPITTSIGGVALNGLLWKYNPNQGTDTIGKYTRRIWVSNVGPGISNSIIAWPADGDAITDTNDGRRKQVTSEVSWVDQNGTTQSVSADTILVDYQGISQMLAPPPPPSAWLRASRSSDGYTANPLGVYNDEGVTLAWGGQYTLGCTASGNLGSWSGAKATSGSQALGALGAGTYTLNLDCIGDGGSAHSTATVNVIYHPPTFGFQINSNTPVVSGYGWGEPHAMSINYSNYIEVYIWSSYATSCTGWGGMWGGGVGLGTSAMYPYWNVGSQTLYAQCSGPGGTAQYQYVTIYAGSPPPPPPPHYAYETHSYKGDGSGHMIDHFCYCGQPQSQFCPAPYGAGGGWSGASLQGPWILYPGQTTPYGCPY